MKANRVMSRNDIEERVKAHVTAQAGGEDAMSFNELIRCSFKSFCLSSPPPILTRSTDKVLLLLHFVAFGPPNIQKKTSSYSSLSQDIRVYSYGPMVLQY